MVILEEEVNKIKNNSDAATFENTLLPLERCSVRISKVSAIFFNLHSAESTPKLQSLAKEISPILTDYANDILLDEVLFSRIKSLHDRIDLLDLNNEQKRYSPICTKIKRNVSRC